MMDNSGIGRSSGEVVQDFTAWAKNTIDVLAALQVKEIDLLGFSMGGCAAQMVTLNAPQLVRRLILAGTFSSIGEGVIPGGSGPFQKVLTGDTDEELHDAILYTFFYPSETSQAAGEAAWKRIIASRKNRTGFLGLDGAQRQAMATVTFLDPNQAKNGSYDRLHEITIPVFIANGMFNPNNFAQQLS
jgi:pimeloyl-ACP methyl ester carboxylesterase